MGIKFIGPNYKLIELLGNKSKAKEWLMENCSDLIEWKNAPKNEKKLSFADEVASWLDL